MTNAVVFNFQFHEMMLVLKMPKNGAYVTKIRNNIAKNWEIDYSIEYLCDATYMLINECNSLFRPHLD